MSHPQHDRTWLIALCVFALAFWLGVVSYIREIAQWKVQLSYRVLSPSLKTDIATGVVSNIEYFRVFTLYSVLLIGLAPILLGRISRLWVGLLLLTALFMPCLWYGLQTTFLFKELIDWHGLASR